MKSKPYTILIVLIVIFGCNKDDNNDPPIKNEVIERFDAVSIAFVHEDGTAIEIGECLMPHVAYAIQIETAENSEGTTQVSKVEYTVNGALYSMSFSQAGIKRNPIILVDGKNGAELVKTALNTEVHYTVQDEFQLVD